MARNIQNFRGNPTLLNKLVVFLAYITLGYTVTAFAPTTLISIYFVLGMLYMLFFQRQKAKLKYFLRYHILQALFLNLTVSMFIWLALALMGLFEAIPIFTTLVTIFRFYLFGFELFPVESGTFAPTIVNLLVMTIALVTSFYALRGRLTELPYISEAVRRFE
jgi:hypothetical protein